MAQTTLSKSDLTDPFTYDNKCTERLFAEWQKHNQLIIAFDFDDTVYDYHSKGHEHEDVLSTLRECVSLGFHLVLYTASKPERYKGMTEYLATEGVYISSINENPIELPFGHNGKIYYNILLDDRAGLGQALSTLKQTIKLINKHKKDDI